MCGLTTQHHIKLSKCNRVQVWLVFASTQTPKPLFLDHPPQNNQEPIFRAPSIKPMVNWWLGSWWFRILNLFRGSSFHKGIPGIQTTGTQTTNLPLVAKTRLKQILKKNRWNMMKQYEGITLQRTNISHLGKRKIIFKSAFLGGYVSSQEGICQRHWSPLNS